MGLFWYRYELGQELELVLLHSREDALFKVRSRAFYRRPGNFFPKKYYQGELIKEGYQVKEVEFSEGTLRKLVEFREQERCR